MATSETQSTSSARPNMVLVWIGRVLSGLISALLILSGVMKLVKNPGVIEGFGKFGIPESLIFGIGVTELICVALYLIPQTAIIGAILLTGYLGGAIMTHLRVGDPVIGQIVFGVVVWLGIFLREPKLRAILPFRKV